MFSVIVNLTLYISGLMTLVAGNFLAVMHLGITDDAAVIALQLSSPFVLWGQFYCYHYLFEGFELLAARMLDGINSYRNKGMRIDQNESFSGEAASRPAGRHIGVKVNG